MLVCYCSQAHRTNVNGLTNFWLQVTRKWYWNPSKQNEKLNYNTMNKVHFIAFLWSAAWNYSFVWDWNNSDIPCTDQLTEYVCWSSAVPKLITFLSFSSWWQAENMQTNKYSGLIPCIINTANQLIYLNFLGPPFLRFEHPGRKSWEPKGLHEISLGAQYNRSLN